MVDHEFPNYANPPLTEAILGLQFHRLAGMSNAHCGAFWQTLPRDDWPLISDAVAIPPQFERFGGAAQWAQELKIRLTQNLAARVQIQSSRRDRMLQVQADRFHFNWLGKGEDYPRYEAVKNTFSENLRLFSQFILDHGMEPIRPNQWEITYVNLIPRGSVWDSVRDWSFFRPNNLAALDVPGLEVERMGGEWHFLIPEDAGRLHVNLQHVHTEQGDQGAEAARLTLTARGPVPEGTSSDDAVNFLDLGHRVIVKAFRHLASDVANTYWGLGNDGP